VKVHIYSSSTSMKTLENYEGTCYK